MDYPARYHRCGWNSDPIADNVITNCKKSAEVIVPKKVFSGRTEQFRTSIKMNVPCIDPDKRYSQNVNEGNPHNIIGYAEKRKGERRNVTPVSLKNLCNSFIKLNSKGYP